MVVGELRPRERLAFVLHDVFGYSFDEVATLTGTTPAATRQAASRARRRIGTPRRLAEGDDAGRDLVDAFLEASREGDIAALVALLAPGVELTADPATMAMGAAAYWGAEGQEGDRLARGADAVARAFSGRAQAARLALIDGRPGAVWMNEGRLAVAFAFTLEDGRVTRIHLVADPAAHAAMDIRTV